MAPPAMTVAGTITTSVNSLNSCALDTTNGFLYNLGTNGTQTVVNKINTGTFTQTGTLTLTLAQADNSSHTGVKGIDISHGYLYYFGAIGNIRAIGAVNLNTFVFANLVNNGAGGWNSLNGNGDLPLVDGALEFLLAAEQTSGGANGINRVTTLPGGFSTGTFLQTNDTDKAMEIDTSNKLVYFATSGTALKKYTYSPNLTFVASLNLPASGAMYASIDTVNSFLYLYNTGNGTIYKVNLSTFAYVSSLTGFAAASSSLSAMDIDVPNGFLYIGGNTSTLTRVDLSTFTVESTITIPTGAAAYGIAYNGSKGRLYCSDGASPSKIYSITVPATPPVFLPESKGNIGAGLKKPNNIFDFNRLMGGS